MSLMHNINLNQSPPKIKYSVLPLPENNSVHSQKIILSGKGYTSKIVLTKTRVNSVKNNMGVLV